MLIPEMQSKHELLVGVWWQELHFPLFLRAIDRSLNLTALEGNAATPIAAL